MRASLKKSIAKFAWAFGPHPSNTINSIGIRTFKTNISTGERPRGAATDVHGGRNGRPWGPTHAKSRQRHLPWWAQQLRIEYLSDLVGSLPRVEKVLRSLKSDGRTEKTLSNYAESLAAFCDWCVKRDYLSENPLKGLKRFNAAPQARRRPLTTAEIHRLLDVAPPLRRLVYTTALSTGLRANELRSLCVRNLDPKAGGLRLEAEWTKNRKDGFLHVPMVVRDELLKVSKGKATGDRLLAVPTHTARSLDHDLKKAGIAKSTDEGTVDFHALRVTYATLLIERGASPKETQELLRHASPDMTMNVYARTRQDSLPRLAERIGETLISQAKCAVSVQRATMGEGDPAVNPNTASGLPTSPQAEGCGFEPRVPLHFLLTPHRPSPSGCVRRTLGQGNLC